MATQCNAEAAGARKKYLKTNTEEDLHTASIAQEQRVGLYTLTYAGEC
jgi:hypothetical protein